MFGYFVVGAVCLIVGFVASFVFYSPEKRALDHLEQIVLSEERLVQGAMSSMDRSWQAGATHAINLFKGHLPRFAHSKT